MVAPCPKLALLSDPSGGSGFRAKAVRKQNVSAAAKTPATEFHGGSTEHSASLNNTK